MDNSYITFKVYSTSKLKSVGFEVCLDDLVIYNNEEFIGEQLIKVALPADECSHSLKLILKNKTADHTVLDPLGAIVQDVNLVIEEIKFDDVALSYNALQTAEYTHNTNGTEELSSNKFFGTIGCNGTVELKFTTPIYLWLLENS